MDQSSLSSVWQYEDERRRLETVAQGERWAREVSASNAWDRLVLTLDGGGIRGYSSLLILDALMKRVAEYERIINGRHVDAASLLPCHYFDYIWGTSTGGLIAIMLGRLRMSVPQALAVYREVGDDIFGRQRKRALYGLNILADRYDARNVANSVRRITQRFCKEHAAEACCDGNDALLWTDLDEAGIENDWSLCQAVAVTVRSTTSKRSDDDICLLRTYPFFRSPDLEDWISPERVPSSEKDADDEELLIWEAARATSAAPTYFQQYTRWSRRKTLLRFLDGGTLLNNPALYAWNEVSERDALVSDRGRTPPALLLSVGTGQRPRKLFAAEPRRLVRRPSVRFWHRWRPPHSLLDVIRMRLTFGHTVIQRLTDTEDTHRNMREQLGTEAGAYRRLNVDVGLSRMGLGDWRRGAWVDPETGKSAVRPGGATLTDMETATAAYLARTELHEVTAGEWRLLPHDTLDQTAQRLVRHRRERAALASTDTKLRRRWETHQGRWVTGKCTEPWEVHSCDGPLEREP